MKKIAFLSIILSLVSCITSKVEKQPFMPQGRIDLIFVTNIDSAYDYMQSRKTAYGLTERGDTIWALSCSTIETFEK